MPVYELHCPQCPNLAIVSLVDPPAAGAEQLCRKCSGDRTTLGVVQDKRVWVEFSCVHCGGGFQCPVFKQHPYHRDALCCRVCFLRFLGVVANDRDAEMQAAEWKSDIAKRTLKLWNSTESINTAGCPAIALRPDTTTEFFGGEGSELYVTRYGYGVNMDAGSAASLRSAYWHPMLHSVTEIHEMKCKISGNGMGIRLVETSRTTGRCFFNKDLAFDAPVRSALKQAFVPIGPNALDAAVDNLIAAWDGNRSLADAIDALRVQRSICAS